MAGASENMLKVNPHPDYPPEEGRNIRGNDFSPVAVAIILKIRSTKQYTKQITQPPFCLLIVVRIDEYECQFSRSSY